MYLPLRIPGLILCQVRWRTIDAVEAARLAEQAREVLPHRRFGKPAVKRDANPSIVSSMYATQRFPQCPDQFGELSVRVVLAQLSGIAARSKQ